MKATLLTICGALVLQVASAQTTTTTTVSSSKSLNPGGIFIRGGLNLANISTSNDGSVDNAKTLASFQVGVIADLPVADVFSVQTGLLFTGKGSKTEMYLDDNNHDDNYYKLKTNPLYIELPVNAVFKFPVGDDARLFVGAGPYIAMGVGGKVKGESKILGATSTYEENIKFNDDDPTTSGQEDASVSKLRRFDYGINALGGIEAGRLSLGLNYGFGLAKIQSTGDSDENDKNKHRVFSITLGVRL